jgi:hypothetical protein
MRNLRTDPYYDGELVMLRHRSAPDHHLTGPRPCLVHEEDHLPEHFFAPRHNAADIARRHQAMQELAEHLLDFSD